MLGVQTLDVGQALFMPIGASLSLLIMFLFFDSLQLMFAVCTASMSHVLCSLMHELLLLHVVMTDIIIIMIIIIIIIIFIVA